MEVHHNPSRFKGKIHFLNRIFLMLNIFFKNKIRKHCSFFSRTNCICTLLRELHSNHRIRKSTRDDEPHDFTTWLNEDSQPPLRPPPMQENGFRTKWEESGNCLFFGNGLPDAHPARLPLHSHPWYYVLVWSGQPQYLFCSLQSALYETHASFPQPLCRRGGVAKTQNTDGTDKTSITCFKVASNCDMIRL